MAPNLLIDQAEAAVEHMIDVNPGVANYPFT
jgi:hypothetical protein